MMSIFMEEGEGVGGGSVLWQIFTWFARTKACGDNVLVPLLYFFTQVSLGTSPAMEGAAHERALRLSIATAFLVIAATAVSMIGMRSRSKRKQQAASLLAPEGKHIDIGGKTVKSGMEECCW